MLPLPPCDARERAAGCRRVGVAALHAGAQHGRLHRTAAAAAGVGGAHGGRGVRNKAAAAVRSRAHTHPHAEVNTYGRARTRLIEAPN